MDIVIRRGTREDLPAIAEIQSGSEQAAQWAPEDYLEHHLYVAESEERVAGFLVTRKVAEGEYEVLNIAVSPGVRRRGIGGELLQRAIRQNPGAYFLEVRESNHPALELYRRIGFEHIGLRQNYYEEPQEAAVVMRILS